MNCKSCGKAWDKHDGIQKICAQIQAMTNSQTPAPPSAAATRTCSEPFLRLELNGYVPMSHNRARGAHWSVMQREKREALKHLRNAISRADFVSGSRSMLAGHATGTTTGPSLYKIALSRLASCPTTTGKSSKAKLSP